MIEHLKRLCFTTIGYCRSTASSTVPIWWKEAVELLGLPYLSSLPRSRANSQDNPRLTLPHHSCEAA